MSPLESTTLSTCNLSRRTPRRIVWRPLAALTLAVMHACLVTACGAPDLVITDFSQAVQLDSRRAEGGHVTGLHLKLDLDADGPIKVLIRCGEEGPSVRTVQPGRSVTRMDWYAPCAEMSFDVAGVLARRLAFTYSFMK